MSKELEALKHLYSFAFDFSFEQNQDIRGDYEIIKSALEHKEKLEKVWAIFNTNHITYEHKEIIKKANNYNEYVDLYRFSFRITDLHEYLVEEEFNLLKEMLK